MDTSPSETCEEIVLPDPDDATGGYEVIRHHVGLTFPDGSIVRIICDPRNKIIEAWLIRDGKRVCELEIEDAELYLERAADFEGSPEWATEL